MAQKTVNVVVTGAAGQIGYSLLPRIASGQMFGPDVLVRLRLLEIENSLPALKGVEMELMDCAFPLLNDVLCTSDVNEAMKDAHWVILVGSAPRKAGMERADLLSMNGHIFKVQGEAINRHASSDVRVFVVGNPCNTNALIARSHARDVPSDRFFAMTALDEKRAIAQLALKAQVSTTAIKNMTIWGNHSSTQFPDFYHAQINGQPATKVISDLNWLQQDFIANVQQRGAAIIKARGASSAASAANAILSSVRSLTTETVGDETFSVGCISSGQYGIDKGLNFSFPCQMKQGKLQIVEGWTHDSFGQSKLELTLNELREEASAVKELGLLSI